MRLPWQHRNDSDHRTITITVSVEELMRLETEAVQERMSVPEYVRAKLFAEDLTPQIRQMFERAQRIDQQMVRITETLGKMAELEDKN